MSERFKRVLFGFKPDDVFDYIDSLHKEHLELSNAMQSKIESLTSELQSKETKLNDLKSENEKISSQLREYTDKYEEINRLSENIGKLYLLAQTNTQAVVQSSAALNRAVAEEKQMNIDSISDAHTSLADIKQNLIDTTSDFSGKVSNLISSLEITKKQLESYKSDSDQRIADFNKLYKSISNG